MDNFSQAVAEWHDFYMMIGTAAATLVGLLFVGLSLNIELLRREEADDLRLLATLTFNCFIYVLLFAVLFLIPRQEPLGLAVPLLLIGMAGLWNTVTQYRKSRASHRVWGRGRVARRFFIPLFSLFCLIIIAVTVLLGTTGGLYWLVPVMLLLLAAASRNAWDLLIGERNK